MAWRIHDSVVRGEIDNTTRGRVTGKLWLHGETEPVMLDLTGNAHVDMAGCRMEFANPQETIAMRRDATFAPLQTGAAGDITASRKVRVLDLPLEEWLEAKEAGKPAPEHWGNCLYLEWYSDSNGRVVVEIPDCEVKVSESLWQLSPKDEEQRAADAEQGFADFMGKLDAAVVDARAEVPDPEEEWDEFDYEKFMRERDKSNDKYGELIEKYGHGPEAQKIIAREMGWTWLEEALEAQERGELESPNEDDDWDEDEGDAAAAAGDEMEGGWKEPDYDDLPEPQLDPLTEGIDWMRDERGHVHHPLQYRSFQAAMALWRAVEELGVRKDDDDVQEMTFKFQQVSAKLAGALNSLGYDGRKGLTDPAFTVARLKRALGILHECQATMMRVKEKDTVPPEVLARAESELFGVREEMLRLMEEFRGM